MYMNICLKIYIYKLSLSLAVLIIVSSCPNTLQAPQTLHHLTTNLSHAILSNIQHTQFSKRPPKITLTPK